jgi:hypothetical protein
MACPYFYPLQPGTRAVSPRDPMLPLGDAWAGVCRATAGQPSPPDEAAIRPLCNLGYARGKCARFPIGDGPDAVRFSILAEHQGGVRISYVVERDHHHFAHGVLDYSTATGTFAERPAGETLERQAQAYAETYRRRKHAD